MTAAEVASALAPRRTVRVTYVRTRDVHRIDVVQGDEVIEFAAEVGGPSELAQDLTEHLAGALAAHHNIDVTRMDADE